MHYQAICASGLKDSTSAWGKILNAAGSTKFCIWDFLSLTPAVVILKDDLTHYCELTGRGLPPAAVVAEAIIDLNKRFEVPET